MKILKIIFIVLGIIFFEFFIFFIGAGFESNYLTNNYQTNQAQTQSYLNDMVSEKNDWHTAENLCVAAITDLNNNDTTSYSIKEGEINVLVNQIDQIERKYPVQNQ